MGPIELSTRLGIFFNEIHRIAEKACISFYRGYKDLQNCATFIKIRFEIDDLQIYQEALVLWIASFDQKPLISNGRFIEVISFCRYLYSLYKILNRV